MELASTVVLASMIVEVVPFHQVTQFLFSTKWSRRNYFSYSDATQADIGLSKHANIPMYTYSAQLRA